MKILKSKKLFIQIPIIIITIYFLSIIVLFINQKSMLYYPNNTDFYKCTLFDKNEIKTYNDTRFYEKKWKKDNLIIYFHGNAWNACDRKNIKEILDKTDSSYIFVEYTGYAENNKKPNIKDILNDADNIWKYAVSKNYKNINAFWISLWTWVASYFSSKYKVDKLLLVSPYSELYKVAQDDYRIFPIKYIFTENYNSINYLKNYKNDLLILHWENDDLIEIKYWKELFNSSISPNKKMIEIENGTHYNIVDNENNREIMIEFLNNNN